MFVEIAWLIPLLPFFGLPLVPLLEYYKDNLGAYLAIALVGLSAIISFGTLIEVMDGITAIYAIEWLSLGGVPIRFGWYIDYLNAFMSTVVSTISTLVLIYSLGYMAHEREKSKLALPRYYLEITFFVGSMLALVNSLNLLQLYMFWEFVGLASYLLIGYWWYKPSAASAAKKAFIVTRLGDVFFSGAVVYAFMYLRTLDVIEINHLAMTGSYTAAMTIIAFLLFGGAMGKSAQFPLHIWLPDAMEGPTTVSALIHAATMVKAGVYLVARFYPVFIHSGELFGVAPLEFVAFIGGLTAFMAGSFALAARGIKKVLAYSTISHLGFMFLALGVGAYYGALFHLLNHAFFKALLFLVSGSVLHAMHDVNDIFEMGGLARKMRITAITGLIAALAISGVPPFNGFWSKEEILHVVNASGNYILVIFGFGAAAMSVLYIFRWWYLIFTGSPRSKAAEHAHESPFVMTGPLMVLAIGSIITGFFGRWVPKLEVGELHHALGILPGEMVPVVSLVFLGVGGLIVTMIYYFGKPSPEIFSRNKVLNAFRVALYNALWIDPLFIWLAQVLFANRYYSLFDRGVIDGIVNLIGIATVKLSALAIWFDNNVVDGAVRGLAWLFGGLGSILSKAHTGVIRHYLVLLLVGLTGVVLFAYVLFFGGLNVLGLLGWGL